MSPHTDPREVEAERFAMELASSLDHAREQHEFDALGLVVPPRFLGLLWRPRIATIERERHSGGA